MSSRVQSAGKLIVRSFLLITTIASATPPGNFYLGGALNESIGTLGNNNSSILYSSGDMITDNYPPNHTKHSSMLLNLNGGYEFSGSRWLPATALGLGVYRTINDYNVSGKVTETSPGNSNDLYNYNYNIKQWIAMGDLKLTWQVWQFAPFINAGIGPAWNELTNYHETPIFDTGFSAAAPFQAKTSVNFAYQLGLGLGYAFNFNGDNTGLKYERASLGYQYMNFGDVSFGIRDAYYPFRLSPGRLTANNFYLSFEHLF